MGRVLGLNLSSFTGSPTMYSIWDWGEIANRYDGLVDWEPCPPNWVLFLAKFRSLNSIYPYNLLGNNKKK